jgi:hypothetical protein
LLRLLRWQLFGEDVRERLTPPLRCEVVELGRPRRVGCVEELRDGSELERLADLLGR